MALPTYASPLERLWHYARLTICALIFVFLIAPIIVIIPLSFNAEPYFTFTDRMLSLDPDGFSTRWYSSLLTFGMQNPDATGWAFYWEHVKQSIMPVVVLGLAQAGTLVRFMRSSVLDVIRLDYVTTARSKGIGESKVIVRHVVRNALIPVVTLIALQLPAVFGGAIVTEAIFNVRGVGQLSFQAIQANDPPVILGVVTILTVVFLVANLVVDILYAALDPRIRYE